MCEIGKSRLDCVIEQVKNTRVGDNRPWIYDKKGYIKDDVIVGDVLPLLHEMKWCEVDVDDDFVGYLLNNSYKSDNTYNWGANISNDINFNFAKVDGKIYIVAMVHLFGDVRGNYSEYFVLNLDREDDFYFFDAIYQVKDIGDGYVANINLYSDTYEVYDYKNDIDVGFYYECKVKDLLEEIKKEQENM